MEYSFLPFGRTSVKSWLRFGSDRPDMGLVKGKLMVSSFLRKIRATFSDLSPFLFHPARVFAASDHPTGRKSKIAPKTLGSGQCPFPLRPRGCDLWYGVLRDRVLSLVAGNLAGCNRIHSGFFKLHCRSRWEIYQKQVMRWQSPSAVSGTSPARL